MAVCLLRPNILPETILSIFFYTVLVNKVSGKLLFSLSQIFTLSGHRGGFIGRTTMSAELADRKRKRVDTISEPKHVPYCV